MSAHRRRGRPAGGAAQAAARLRGPGWTRARLAYEAAALDGWHTVHAPAVLALDEQLGALLIEAIEPGTPLVVSATHPALEIAAELLSSLHASGVPDPSYPTVAQRVANLLTPQRSCMNATGG